LPTTNISENAQKSSGTYKIVTTPLVIVELEST